MKDIPEHPAAGCRRNITRSTVLAMVGAGFLAGCNTSGSGSTGSPVDDTFAGLGSQPGLQANSQPPNDAVQDPRAYCPRAILRAGTETYNVFPDGLAEDDPERGQQLRFRATITEVVRECNSAGNFLNIKVGVAGRVLSGPSGETGTFAMPIRVAVTRGSEVLYSTLHDVPADIPPGRTNTTFSFVDSAITIPKPERENIIIYAGYDEQRVDLPGATAADGSPRDLRPVN